MQRTISIQRALGFTVALAVGCGISVLAQTIPPPDAFEGTWKLNTAKSKFDPGPAPKSMTATFVSAADAARLTLDMVAADGTTSTWSYLAKLDGQNYPLDGNPDADTISAKRINARSVETTFKKGGKVTMVNTRTVSADGKTMTVTSTGTNAQGQKVNNVQVFDKS